MRRIVGFGHSHLHAILDADAARRDAGEYPSPPVTFIQLLSSEYRPTIDENGRLNPGLKTTIGDAMASADGAEPLLFSCVSGNEYHFIGLVNDPRRFDFVLPGNTHLPLDGKADVIPYDLVRRALQARMGDALLLLQTLARNLGHRFVQIQSPPPIGDNGFIERHPIQFAPEIVQYGVSPAALRLKLWLLQSDLFRSACEALGIAFLSTPPAALDQDGFLDQRGWQPDPVHANRWYGELVLRQLETEIAVP